MNFYFSNGNEFKNIKSNEKSLEKEFSIFLDAKQIRSKDIYISTTKKVLPECQKRGILSVDSANLDIFSLTDIEVIKNICNELRKGILVDLDKKSKGAPHACLNSNYIDFLTYYHAYMSYRENLKFEEKSLPTTGNESFFKVFYKENCSIQVQAVNSTNYRSYSLDRFLNYCVNPKNESGSSYAPILFDDILQHSKIIIKTQAKDLNKNIGEKQMSNQEIKNQPLNQILYGSPGTGKTYNTIDRALCILGFGVIVDQKCILEYEKIKDELAYLEINFNFKNDRSCAKALFDHYCKEEYIEFVTFHQSYGHEEFVEGIKPIEKDNAVIYRTQDGIFKKISLRANREKDFESFFKYFTKKQRTLRGKAGTPLSFDKNSRGTLTVHFTNGEKNLSIDYNKVVTLFNHFKDKRNDFYAMKNIATEMEKILDIKNIPPTAYWTIIDFYFKEYLKPYILIIDEINRGNISKIFGELITLIEPSKRIGAEEELRVTLPYSQTSFGVPNNLYIIGTMNTADRSITSLDTALRRRFEFVEMMPDATKLEGKVIEGINLQKMLTAINERIEFLYDREKTIGHAYLLDIKNLDDLKEAFQNKIIPLLQEYFYRNYTLIQAVLNDNGMIKEIEDSKKTSIINCKGFKKLENIDFESKTIYSISDDENLWDDPQTYINIYEG
ncbi:MAG TPA: AAA family ATPase [Candidatus Helicobacter avistercoris]|nr:AAA family ATPase [Candidatus Helicobacter avistercoris]